MSLLQISWVKYILLATLFLAGAFFFDTHLFFFLNNFAGKSTAIDFIIIFFAHYLAYFLSLLLLLYILFNKQTYKQKILFTATTLLAGLFARYDIAETLRYFWHRPRPFVSHHATQLLSESSYSFPSGHSTFFFALSTVVYLYHKKLGILFYVATIFMTIGRVIAGVHYPSDIVAGAIIGIICGLLTYRYIMPWISTMLMERGTN
jgi:undecaprenyl-diphosphatase